MVAIISTAISVICMLIVVLPTLVGIVRGANKSLFRLVFVFATGLLSFLLAGLIANAFVNLDISFLNLQIDGQTATSIPKAVELFLGSVNSDFSAVVSDNPEITTLAISLCLNVLKLIAFVLLFWLLKWLLWPVWAVLAHVFFKNTKTRKTKAQVLPNNIVIPERTEVIKKPKRAWLGAICGFVMGVITLGFTVIPLSGISNTLIELDTVTATEQEDGTTKGIISEGLGEDTSILYVYRDSVAGKVLSAVGINQVSGAIAKSYATFTHNGEKISALDEIVEFGKLGSDIKQISEIDFNNLDQATLVDALPAIDTVQKSILSSGIVQGLYNQLVPYFVDNILDNPDFFIELPDLGNDILNNGIKDVLSKLKDITATDLSNDISTIIKSCQEINETKILEELIDGVISIDTLKEQLTIEMGDKIVDHLFELKTTNTLVLVVLNTGIEYLCEQIDVQYVENENEVSEQDVKNVVKAVVDNGIIIVKNIDTSEDMPIAHNTFENIGLIADSIIRSNIVGTTTKDNLFDYVITEANDFVEDFDLDTDIKDCIKLLIADVKNIPNYASECKAIGEAYKYYTDNETAINDSELVAMAGLVDKITPTYLYNHNIDDILTEVTSLVTTYITDNEVPMDTENIAEIIAKVKKVDSFEAEVQAIKELVDYVSPMIENDTLSEDMKDEAKLTELGRLIDATIADGSVLLDDGSCKLLLKNIIKQVELPSEFSSIVVDEKPVKEVIQNNVDKIQSYETELKYVAKVLNAQDGLSLTETGALLDSIKNSVLLDGVIVEVVRQNIDEKIESITDEDLKQILSNVSDNIEQIQSYEAEFDYLNSLANIDLETASLQSVGATLDVVKDSKLLNGVIDDLIIYQIDENTTDITDTEILDVIEKIKTNVPQIQSYETELVYLQNFADLDVENASMTSFGEMLDSFVDSKLFEGTTAQIFDYALTKGGETLEPIYTDIYTKIKTNSQNLLPEEKQYKSELEYVQSFVDFANSDVLKTPENIENFLEQNILDENDNSKSILIDNAVVEEIRNLVNSI